MLQRLGETLKSSFLARHRLFAQLPGTYGKVGCGQRLRVEMSTKETGSLVLEQLFTNRNHQCRSRSSTLEHASLDWPGAVLTPRHACEVSGRRWLFPRLRRLLKGLWHLWTRDGSSPTAVLPQRANADDGGLYKASGANRLLKGRVLRVSTSAVTCMGYSGSQVSQCKRCFLQDPTEAVPNAS